MKIRNGFVSNSSSMSSIVFPKDDNILINEDDPAFEGYLHVDVQEEDYGRSRNEILISIEDKLRFFIAMYAYDNHPDSYEAKTQEELDKKLENYFEKMSTLREKLHKMFRKYDIDVYLCTPEVTVREDTDFDPETGSFIKTGLRTYGIHISTENFIFSSVADMTDEQLEKFLFDKRSFAIVGGDEYRECYDNEWRMKQTIDYEYERFADHEDHEEGDYSYTDSEGVKHYWEHSSHWGEIVPDYYDTDHIPDYDHWDDEQPNLPFSKDYQEDIL